MEHIERYFPDLTNEQKDQFRRLKEIYEYWNLRINVISRKDMDQFYTHHVLHSLAIARIIDFKPNTTVLDVGTGGGFPGIPLAILFPEVSFHLVDSIKKKIKVVQAVKDSLGLKNVKADHIRAEDLTESYHFIVSRAVTAMPRFVDWVGNRISKDQFNDLTNGILYLKGGDLKEELREFPKVTIYDLAPLFEEPFFETKKLVHLVL
ncbi:MAG: 16S rRNA (guanine(527)-N(7))-methyltransferase RsmG [Flavobacteriaceae bacterium]|nr:16S rRNA (guanine(527)-N(7))-methyltransferase RsmG [Bacteroidia bacterium]MBT8288670.1 16S rRNA (guanine(527)-N(7))-methyltransferase RsmG [Bacteroidia bacterium]NNF76264.1 16S rRNA (guanine(527)-N(7))-methyltransferase RsmG [Flavobacteriaceae bacterium]NNK73034.1 16S rRNA (guanine(527)-N(7))-methyltransferase RsmG [Flavobacteriaceae bacterium]